jgi:uncharacterized repeat protein (TIGR01451 family)
MLAAGLLLMGWVMPAGAITITRTSGAVMQTDIAKGLTCAYVSYIIANNTASAYSNVWVKADSFTGGIVSLGGGDHGLYQLDDLAPGAYKMAFFYVRATATTTLPQSHVISVYEGYPGQGGTLVANQTFSLTVAATQENNSSKVSSVTYNPQQPTVGGTVLVKVVGDAGNVRNRDVIDFTPAAFTNWNAAAFELIGVTLSLTNKNIQARTISNYLELPLEYSTWAAGNITYTAYYTFRAMAETDAVTPVSPITYATQGSSSSHTITTGYGSFAPIQSPTNTTVLAKLANVTQLYTNEVATYTVRFTNSGPNNAGIDRIVDTLPLSMSYVPGSSRFNGQLVLDPAVSGTLLTWSEAVTVPAKSSRDFVFQARALVAGYPTNQVVAYVGGDSTLIDTTLRTDDSVPGKVTVRTLLAPTAVDDAASVVEDGALSVPAPGVLANDSDLNRFVIHVVSHTQPAHGVATLNANGSWTYTPTPEYYGYDSFSYTITINNGRTATATVNLTVLEVNDAPGFTAGANQTVLMDAGAQTVTSWSTAISKGPANEAGQVLTFVATNDNAALFSAQPAVAPDGTLTYTPAPGLGGIATVTLYLQDDGGVANGGVDSSPSITFEIQVIAYSLGNWVFDDTNNNGIRDFGENGIGGVQMAIFTNSAGLPAGGALMTTATDAHGDYRFDNLPAGTYIVVADVANSPNLSGFASSSGCSTDMTLSGGMRDHGQDTPVSAGEVTNGIASLPVTVGEGLQPIDEIVANEPGPGTYGPLGDAYDNLVLDFGFTPTYSIGNRVFFDNNHNTYQDTGDEGVPDVPMTAFEADENGLPIGSALASTTTDSNGWYRLDGLRAGTYVVVLDKQRATNLAAYTSTIGCSTNMTLDGDLWDHGWYFPQVTVGGITNGYPSSPVTVGLGLQPVGEAIDAGAGAHGPLGDAYDNLVLDFAMARSFCIGNRVFSDDGSGGGTPNNGIQDGTEAGISNVALRVFAADAFGNPVGNAIVIGESNLNVVVTDSNGWFRFFRMTAGTYVVVVDVGLSRDLHGYAYRNGSTWIDPAAVSTSLVGYASSSGISSDLTLAGDRCDHGFDTPVSVGEVAYGIAGPPVTLSEGVLPLGEETNGVSGAGSHGPGGDANDILTLDFGFTPSYSLGNRVFLDNGASGGITNNAAQDGAEPGLANVTVALQTNGVTLATTVTDADGYYRFDALMAGTYTVCLPASNFQIPGALSGLIGSFGTNALDRGDKGISSGSPSVAGITNAPVTLGMGLSPTNETDLATGAGANSPNGTTYDNLTIDFGLIETNNVDCGLGSLVWHDANNDGLWESGESGIAGVTVEVWSSDETGALLGGAAVTSTVTDVSGIYAFYPLAPGMYRVRIPTNNFATGQALAATNTSSTLQSGGDGNVDNNNNGMQAAAGQEVLSPVITLRRGGEAVDGTGPYDESGPGANWDNLLDVNGNMTVDFGFYSPANDQANLCSLGSLVWEDANNNGVWDSGEPGVPGVSLELYQTNASGRVYWSATTSASDGTYCFRDLPSGTNWVIRIPATNFVAGGALATCPLLGGTSVNADNQTENDNNGLQPDGMDTDVWSPVIALAAGAEPTNSLTGEFGVGASLDNTGSLVDANGDMTVGFGFTATYSLGNRVFLDLDNNGILDGADSGVSGALVKLFWADGSGNPTGAVLAAATTDASGYYRFDDLLKGSYVAVVDQANSPDLAWTLSSSGASPDTSLAGDGKDHGKDTPVSVGGVVNGIAGMPVTVGFDLQPVGEATNAVSGAGANGPHGDLSDNLTMDFGFTPTYSIGNKVFRDPDNDGQPDMDNLDEGGITNVLIYVFAADASGKPTGAACGSSVTDSNGYYRVDGLVAGTYVVVVDVTNSPALSGYRSVTGASDDITGVGNLRDHGLDAPLDADSVVPGGIASVSVTVGPGLQPVDGSTGPGLGANGPSGDANDNLVIDFGFYPLYSLGNRVFDDANNNGVLDGEETGVEGAALVLFAADGSGSPIGGVVSSTSTDAGGYYRFDDLPAGIYVVVVDLANSEKLAGYVSSAGATTDTTLDGDLHDHGLDTPISVGPIVNGIASAPVAVGEFEQIVPLGEATGSGNGVNGPNGDDSDNLIVDFGFTETASVSGNVYEDINGNGFVNGVDTNSIEGVTVLLKSPSGAVLFSALTDAEGAYAFNDLAPGDYLVEAVALPGWVNTGDLGEYGNGDGQVAVSLASGQNAGGVLFLMTRPGMIEGTVWDDFDADGVFDPEETIIGLGGVTVSLETNGVTVATTTTMTGGKYLFENVLPGAYSIVQSDLAGWFSTADTDGGNDNCVAVSLSSGGHATGNDFLDYTYAVISGRVLVDSNGNGQSEAGEANGISGVTVRLLDAGEHEVDSAETGADGSFTFTDLLPGSYTLAETDPTTYVSTSANGIGITVTSGQESDGHVFLDAQPGSVGDFVWEDIDGNGLQYPGEPGISNVVVRLTDTEGNEISTNLTGAAGAYAFTNLVPGVYFVQILNPAGYTGTVSHVGADAALDSEGDAAGWSWPVLVASGEDQNGVDFGIYRPVAIGNLVWNDLDKDGIQDAGEAGMTNIAVSLYSIEGAATNLVDSTTTDASGVYAFQTAPGDYVLRVDAPDGYAFSPLNAGGNPETDSDFGPTTPYSALMTVSSGDSILAADAGLYYAPTLSVITSFRAYAEGGNVFVAWETAAEYDTMGYWIDRLVNGAWTRLNPDEPVWSEMTGRPASYTLADPGAAPGGTYTWRIVEIEGSGAENVYGPYTVTVNGAAADYDSWAESIAWNGAANGFDDDPDGDGLSNFEEFLAGTDPLNANSVLKITGICPVANGIEIRWASVVGKEYTVEHTRTLGGAWLPVKTGLVAEDEESRFTLPGSDGGFFRIVVKGE